MNWRSSFPRLSTLLLLLSMACALQGEVPAPSCDQCAVWNTAQEPFQIYGNTYYVGPHGLSSILITSSAGHILIDGALPESAAQIAAHIRKLGFRVEDVKYLVNSHVHFDHAGGIAKLQRLSGATVLASPWSAAVMRTGQVARDDPQHGTIRPIARVAHVRTIHDGESVSAGTTLLTAHFTPGHTPGGTSWTWKSCDHEACQTMVYADSLSPISADDFRFTDSQTHPHAIIDFENSFAFLDSVPCDILLTPHPDTSGFWEKLAKRQASPGTNPLVDLSQCRQLAATGREALRDRVAKETRR